MANRIFLVLMALSSALGFGKALAIAALLPTDDFGRYSIFIAIALFISPLPGLGLIEETRKMFPRLFVENRLTEIVLRADHITKTVGLRTGVLGSAAAAIFYATGAANMAAIAVALALVAFGSAWSSTLASALRAGTSPILLGITSFTRAAITIPATMLAGSHFGLIGVLWGEAIAALIGGAIMRYALRWQPEGVPVAPGTAFASRASRNGMLVFMGSALVAAPLYLNRPVAALALTPEQVGTLSFLLVLVGVFQTAIAICDQIMGPRIVHRQHEGMPLTQQKRRFLLLVAALAMLALASFGILWGALYLQPLSHFAEKYQLTTSLLIPTAVLAALNITSTGDWMLQAQNKEHLLTLSSAVTLAAFVVLAVLVVFGLVGIQMFLWGLVAGKLLQLIVQIAMIMQIGDAAAA